MMKASYFLSVEEAPELHRMLIEQFGGSPGVRDRGLVESAVFRPRSGYYATLSIQAAALLQSFALNHAFVDGNKRVAFAAAAVFLSINDYKIKLGASEGETFNGQKVITEKVALESITTWLESHMIKKK